MAMYLVESTKVIITSCLPVFMVKTVGSQVEMSPRQPMTVPLQLAVTIMSCLPSHVVQSVVRMTQEPEVLGSIHGLATYFPFSFS